MKKLVLALEYIFIAFLVFLPIGVTLSARSGYVFDLINYSVFAIITVLLAIGILVLCVVKKEFTENKYIAVLLTLTAPLSLINSFFYLSKCSDGLVLFSMLVCVCCCCYLLIKYGKPRVFKLVSLGLSAFMALPFLFFTFVLSIFGGITQDTIFKSVESPNGIYCAEVIDNNQGALGGNTYVEVRENKGINAFIFNTSKKSQTIYRGRWGEFETMEIYWKNDNCLVINFVEYTIE